VLHARARACACAAPLHAHHRASLEPFSCQTLHVIARWSSIDELKPTCNVVQRWPAHACNAMSCDARGRVCLLLVVLAVPDWTQLMHVQLVMCPPPLATSESSSRSTQLNFIYVSHLARHLHRVQSARMFRMSKCSQLHSTHTQPSSHAATTHRNPVVCTSIDSADD
jgi:hypothetical protein